MTYDQIAKEIEKMTPEQRQQTATVMTLDYEYIAVSDIAVNGETDVLDGGHLVFLLEGGD